MSNNQVVHVECYGDLQRVPVENSYITIDKLKSIICKRLKIDYPFKLTYEGADLCDTDTVHDLNLNPSHPVRVRRCSIDDSYTTPDSNTEVFLSYEQTHLDTIVELKRKLEDDDYSCWLDVEQMSGNIDHFSSAIEQGIQNSTVFVACITSRYAQATKCRQELSYAKQHGKQIILLLMEALHWPPQQIGILVSGLSYIEFYNTASSASSTSWPSEKFRELLAELSKLVPHI